LNNLIAVLLIMAVSAAWAPNTFGADASKRYDASAWAKSRIERERQFLYRVVEELNRSQVYVLATMRGLEKQFDAVDSIEPSRREKDIRSYLEWYQAYAEWLRNNVMDFEADLSRAYSDEGAVVRLDRSYSLLDGCTQVGSQLEEQVAHLEKLNDRTEQRISGLRWALEYISSAAFLEERNRDKKQSKSGTDRRKDEMFDRYKDITDVEIAVMQLELKNLTELQKHYAVLIEMGRMEQFWISRKAGDYEALSRLAGVVGRDTMVSIEEASNRMIKIYESDIAFFTKKVDEISHARSRGVPSGTLRTLDRVEEMAENYDQMKSRYEHHMTWLAEQAGAYRADLIELGKEK
jgi:hypothetical protein